MANIYKVEGMSCGGCSSSVEQAIKRVAPDASVEVELEGGLVRVEGVEPRPTDETLDITGLPGSNLPKVPAQESYRAESDSPVDP